MAATLGSIVEGVLDHLYGHSAQQDATAELAAPITSSATSLTVDSAQNISAGLIEVDMELMRVKGVDLTSQSVTLRTLGRGVRGTTAASHATGAEVRVAPIMPYFSVVREVNAEIASMFPALSAVGTVELPWQSTQVAYDLPADAVSVLDVRYRDPLGNWERVRAWEVEYGQNLTDHPTGKTLRAGIPYPATLRIIYGKAFTPMATLADTLADTGLPESTEDVLRMGAILRLLPSLDLARLSVITTQSADANGKPPQPGTGVAVAREVRNQYAIRREQEIGKFRQQYPSRCHFTR